jgi:hypothetical protein
VFSTFDFTRFAAPYFFQSMLAERGPIWPVYEHE